jgi:hypothetical protein
MKVSSSTIRDRTAEDDGDFSAFQYLQKQFQQNRKYRESQIRSAANRIVSGLMENQISMHKVIGNDETRHMP